MQRTFVAALTFAGILISFAAVSAKPVSDEIIFPNGFRDWFLINSMIVTKDSPISDQIGGIHHIYVNATGLPTLKKGGPFPYPDGTVFADDVHEFSVKDGSYVEGNKKAVPIMVKDAKKYASTGGWGFQVWAGGDPLKPLVPDAANAVQACFVCHTPQKDQDYTFSTYIRLEKNTKMSQEQTARIAQKLLAEIGSGAEPDEIAAMFSADVQFQVPGDVGALPWIGRRTGRNAVSDFVLGTRSLLERIRFNVNGILADEGRAVIFGELAMKVNATGKIIESPFALIFYVSGGEITSFQMLEDSFAVSQAARP